MIKWENGKFVIRFTTRTKFGHWLGGKVDGKTFFVGGKKWDIFFIVAFSVFAYISAFVNVSPAMFMFNLALIVTSAIRYGKRGSAE